MQSAPDIMGANVEYANQTTLHPVGLAAVIVLGLATLMLPRRYAVIPMLIMVCFIAPAQRIVILSLDFNLLRIMVLFGWMRILMSGDLQRLRFNALDVLVVAHAVVATIAYTMQQESVAGLVYRLGQSFDEIGFYFLFRCLIRSWDDVWSLARGLAVIAVPVAIAFLIEKSTGRNAFAFLGGVPEVTAVREGKLRAQGAFSHAILAGTFWAAVVPIIAALWWNAARERSMAVIGVGAAIVIIVASASSTPVAAFAAAIVGGMFFVMRHWMRWVWGSALMAVVGLHLTMNAPVWHLISRIDLVGGSTGWHRFNLIDQAIRRVGEWWFVGTRSTGYWGWGLSDVTNQYVVEGVRGGLATLILFMAMIVVAFSYIGRVRKSVVGDTGREWLVWMLGVMLFVHVSAFLAVSYFGQIVVVWYLTLAMIGALYAIAQPSRAFQPQRSVTRPSAIGRWSTFAPSVPRSGLNRL